MGLVGRERWLAQRFHGCALPWVCASHCTSGPDRYDSCDTRPFAWAGWIASRRTRQGGEMDEQPEGGGPDDGMGETESVLTLVCLTCGQEYYFTSEQPPAGLSCEKCGSTVFREFFASERMGEAAQDFDDTTARDLDPDDAEGEALPGDVLDLNRD